MAWRTEAADRKVIHEELDRTGDSPLLDLHLDQLLRFGVTASWTQRIDSESSGTESHILHQYNNLIRVLSAARPREWSAALNSIRFLMYDKMAFESMLMSV